jgi:hypothetical protein
MVSKSPSLGVLVLSAVLIFVVGIAIGMKFAPVKKVDAFMGMARRSVQKEAFEDSGSSSCPEPDPSKWVLKTTVPPCPPLPDMSKYMLKTECPPQPDMSKYVLKTSVPACPPCISTCSKPCKIGECPACPRPRCPTVKCPEPKACPACPTVQVQSCPEPKVQCNARYESSESVRPMLSSTSSFGF